MCACSCVKGHRASTLRCSKTRRCVRPPPLGRAGPGGSRGAHSRPSQREHCSAGGHGRFASAGPRVRVRRPRGTGGMWRSRGAPWSEGHPHPDVGRPGTKLDEETHTHLKRFITPCVSVKQFSAPQRRALVLFLQFSEFGKKNLFNGLIAMLNLASVNGYFQFLICLRKVM